jgi:hypothetical protein
METKEFDVSTEDTQHGFPAAEAEALIGKILEDVRSIRDPAILNACRSLFRSRVPFHLRSYVAAALILRALGASAGPRRTVPAPAPVPNRAAAPKGGRRSPLAAPVKTGAPSAKPGTEDAPESADLRIRKGSYTGEGTTLFFSMGRRQRFTAQNVLRVLSGISGLEESDIGSIRTFDNYTFVNVHPAAADLVIQDADGTSFKGRKLAVNRARPRKEESRSGKPEDRTEGDDGPEGDDPVNG